MAMTQMDFMNVGGGGVTYVEDDTFNGTGTTKTYNVTNGMIGLNNSYYGNGGYVLIHEGSMTVNALTPAAGSASYSDGVLTLTRGSRVSTETIYGYYS